MRRPQFSIRTLLWLTLVVAIFCQTGPLIRDAMRPVEYIPLDAFAPPIQECLPDGTSLDLVKLDLKTGKFVWVDTGEPVGK
jgi:hypothetical protein